MKKWTTDWYYIVVNFFKQGNRVTVENERYNWLSMLMYERKYRGTQAVTKNRICFDKNEKEEIATLESIKPCTNQSRKLFLKLDWLEAPSQIHWKIFLSTFPH